MYFSDTSSNQNGLVQEIDDICSSNSSTYPVARKTRRINDSLDRFFFLATRAAGSWQFDDSNRADFPIATTSLVSGQYDYSFANDMAEIVQVQVQDQAGNWTIIDPVDINERLSRNVWERVPASVGIPIRYDKFANSLLLDPTPNYNKTGGLKVVYKRTLQHFVPTDALTEPGVPSQFHMYLARHAALPYLVENELKKAGSISTLVAQGEAQIQEHYAKRPSDERTKLTPKYFDPR
jgi:hypothetical protein